MKYPKPEIPDDSEKKSGTDWVLPKIIGSGRVSGTRLTLILAALGGDVGWVVFINGKRVVVVE